MLLYLGTIFPDFLAVNVNDGILFIARFWMIFVNQIAVIQLRTCFFAYTEVCAIIGSFEFKRLFFPSIIFKFNNRLNFF